MIVKSPCQQCGVNIEFDAESANQLVPCPSCGKQTRLLMPGTTEYAKTVLAAKILTKPEAVSGLPPVKLSGVATALRFCGVIDIFGGVLGGLMVGSENDGLGVAVFVGGVVGGFILLGVAEIVDHTKQSAERLRRIEILLQKANEDKNAA